MQSEFEVRLLFRHAGSFTVVLRKGGFVTYSMTNKMGLLMTVPCLFLNKISWHPAIPIYLHVIWGRSAMSELVSSSRDHMTHRDWNIYWLILYKKSSPTSDQKIADRKTGISQDQHFSSIVLTFHRPSPCRFGFS